MKVLIVEDNPEVIEIITQTFKLRWPEVNLISTFLGKEGVELVKKELPDIVILDLGLPDMDGFQVLQQIRGFSDVPLVILTVRGDEELRIKGLEEGADDYIVKPFSPGELVARLRAVLRRSLIPETTTKVDDESFIGINLKIDVSSQSVFINDKLVNMGPREYDLLYHLVSNKGMVLSKEMLMTEVFPEHKGDTQFLEVYIKKLKEKLEANPDNPKMILNEGRIGYKFVDP